MANAFRADPPRPENLCGLLPYVRHHITDGITVLRAGTAHG
jgi:hypothetical protein